MRFTAITLSVLAASGALAGPVKRHHGHKKHKRACTPVVPDTTSIALPVETYPPYPNISSIATSVVIVPTTSEPVVLPTDAPTSIEVEQPTSTAINVPLPVETTSTAVIVPSSVEEPKPASTSTTSVTATASATSVPAPPATGRGTTKRGILAINGDWEVTPFIDHPKISWVVNDWNGAPGNTPDTWDFVPTMWNPTPDKWWDQNLDTAAKVGYQYVVGLSESDMSSPAFTPDMAVTHWREHMEAAATRLVPAAPVIQDVDYLEEFWTKCEAAGCKFLDGNTPIGFNVYVSGDQAGLEHVQKIVERIHTRWPTNPIWVQNIGLLADSNGTTMDLINILVPYLEATSYITRYAVVENFWTGENELNELGLRYATM